MNVLHVLLWAIGVPLAIAAATLPAVLLFRGWEAWRAVPPEVYASHRQRLLGITPIWFWIIFAFLSQVIPDILERWVGHRAERIAENVTLAIVAPALIYHLFWAARIIRSRVPLDSRLVRFARYALWDSALCLAVIAAGISLNLIQK